MQHAMWGLWRAPVWRLPRLPWTPGARSVTTALAGYARLHRAERRCLVIYMEFFLNCEEASTELCRCPFVGRIRKQLWYFATSKDTSCCACLARKRMVLVPRYNSFTRIRRFCSSQAYGDAAYVSRRMLDPSKRNLFLLTDIARQQLSELLGSVYASNMLCFAIKEGGICCRRRV